MVTRKTFEVLANLPVPQVVTPSPVTLDNTTQTIDHFAIDPNEDSFFLQILDQLVEDEGDAGFRLQRIDRADFVAFPCDSLRVAVSEVPIMSGQTELLNAISSGLFMPLRARVEQIVVMSVPHIMLVAQKRVHYGPWETIVESVDVARSSSSSPCDFEP